MRSLLQYVKICRKEFRLFYCHSATLNKTPDFIDPKRYRFVACGRTSCATVTKPGKPDRFNLQKQKNLLDAFNFATAPKASKTPFFDLCHTFCHNLCHTFSRPFSTVSPSAPALL